MTYNMPTNVHFGVGIFEKFFELFSNKLDEKVLIVVGRTMTKLGFKNRIKNKISNNAIFFHDYDPNPTTEQTQNCLQLAQNENPSLVISIGGGSAIDLGKVVAFLYPQVKHIKDFFQRKSKEFSKGADFIAIPTTAGTGSEVTCWASIWEGPKKYSISNQLMYPKYAVVDPTLTKSAPRNLTITTGLDAFSHAVEAIWAKSRNFVSTQLAKQAIVDIYINLPKLINDLENIEYRFRLMNASLLAGLAFSNTRTTAMHSFSYPMTGFWNIPHGLACFLTLCEIAKFNNIEYPEIIEDIYRPLNFATIDDFIDGVDDFANRLGVNTRLHDYSIQEKDIEKIIENGFTPGRIDNNPRKLTKLDAIKILTNIY